jgi:hypothetical protein
MNPILVRVKKLLALANDGGATEAEAALAAAKVQEILQDHGLTLAQVEATQTDPQISTREKRALDHRAMYEYQRDLMRALAENNFCLHHVARVFVPHERRSTTTRIIDGVRVTGYHEKRHVLVGRQLNVEVTQQTYEYLLGALRRANPYSHVTVDGKRFLSGAVQRLTERLAERRRERELASAQAPTKTNGTGRELVLSDVYGTEADLNNDTLNGFPAGTTATRNREAEARRARQQAEHDRLVAEGTDSTEAWYRAYGYEPERAAMYAAKYNRRAARAGRGRTRNWTRGDEAHYAKVNSPAYQAGKQAGDAIGLDDQVGQTQRRRLA